MNANEGYTERKGTVLLAGSGGLVVRVERGEEDEDCGGCRACALRSLCKGKDTRKMDLPIAPLEGRTYAPGDGVRVAYRQANAAVAAAVMFLPPLAGLAAGGFLAAGRSDAALLIGCLAGAAAGVGFSWLLSRRAGMLRPDVRLLPDAE